MLWRQPRKRRQIASRQLQRSNSSSEVTRHTQILLDGARRLHVVAGPFARSVSHVLTSYSSFETSATGIGRVRATP